MKDHETLLRSHRRSCTNVYSRTSGRRPVARPLMSAVAQARLHGEARGVDGPRHRQQHLLLLELADEPLVVLLLMMVIRRHDVLDGEGLFGLLADLLGHQTCRAPVGHRPRGRGLEH